MKKLFCALLFFPSIAMGAGDGPRTWYISEPISGTLLINAATEAATRNTGAVKVAGVPYLAMHVDHTDANSSVTSVTATCYGGLSSAVTSSTGYILQDIALAAGVGTSSDLSLVKAVSGSKKWFWVIDTRGASYVICYFAFGGTPAAADLITVTSNALTAP